MSATTAPALMTTEELLAMPENGMDRWLVRGELREQAMTVRNRWHSQAMVRIATELENWRMAQPAPRGQVLCGEAGAILQHSPDTTVGLDVAYISAEVASKLSDDTTLIDGVPTLAVEILSPSDTQKTVSEKVNEYLKAGVALVWVVDPEDRIVRVYRHGTRPVYLAEDQELSGEPHLPGFRVAVSRLFE